MENRFRGHYAKEDIGKVKLLLRSVADGGSDAQSSPTIKQVSELLRKAMLMLDDLSAFYYKNDDKAFFRAKYAIVRPGSEGSPEYVGWVTDSEMDSWRCFFNSNPSVSPLGEAIKAYKAIGYFCISFTINEYTKLREKYD